MTDPDALLRFVADMGHELRTPLTAIRGFADLLRDSVLEPADRQYLETIHRNCDHLLEIVNDLLDLSKLEAGMVSIVHAPLHPGQLLLDLDALFGARAAEQGIAWRAAFDGAIPAAIESDELRLRQILINLVANALHHTTRGEVTLIARMPSPGGAWLELEVTDTGVGMDEAQLARLFVPFGQVGRSPAARAHGAHGSGLGLAISAKLARALGAELAIRSTPGVGTSVTLRVPTGTLRDVPLATELAATRTTPCPVIREGAIGRRVLVADDDADAARVVRTHLERAGATVVCVGDGAAAVAAALDGPPFDLVLMDLRMPILDGYSATRLLRDRGYAGRIVALAVPLMAGDDERCLEAGCDDYVAKPIALPCLLDLIAPRSR